MSRAAIEDTLKQEYKTRYVDQFAGEYITRAFTSIVAAATKVLGQLDVEQSNLNRIRLLKTVVKALEDGADWEPPRALVAGAETKARIKYNNEVKTLLDDLESVLGE